MNLLHDIAPGENIPESINVIVEIPSGSNNKYEIDKKTSVISLDRVNYSAAPYPFDYGFVPQTLWDDGDALDVVIISSFPFYPGIMVKVKPVGVLEMVDEGESDYKIIGVPVDDQRFANVNDVKDLNQHKLKEISHFFETYKQLKNDKKENVVEVQGFKPKEEAFEAIKKAIELYKEKGSK